MTSKFPPRRLLAVAAALAIISAPANATDTNADPGVTPEAPSSCPLGSFHCKPRPVSYAMCRPNAMLNFYDPELGTNPALRDTSPVHMRAKQVDSSNRSIYHLSGDVRMQRADQLLQTDTLDYNQNSTDYDAQGNVRYQDAGQLLAASHMRGNNRDSHATADDVRYQLLKGRGNGVAKKGTMLDAQHTRYTRATYSTCDVGHHVWEFRGKSITMNKDTGVGVARDATMRLGHVPFLYLPYLSFPIDNRRKSGFLAPTLGKTSRAGFELSTPYYLNLAPNYDATLDPRIYTQRGSLLASEFRFLVPGSQGLLDLEYVPNDNGKSDGLAHTKGKKRYRVHVSDLTKLWGNWALVADYNHVSDSSYLYDYGNALSSGVIYSLASNVAVLGHGEWWNAAIGATWYENTNPFLTDAGLPYRQLPYATYNLQIPISRRFEFGMDNEAKAFRKPGHVEGQREDLYPYLQADFGSSAWFVRPRVAYRYTAYQLNGGYQNYGYFGRLAANQATPFTSQSPTRALPVASIDSGLIFDRSIDLFGKSFTQTLEPRLYYLYVPYRNQDDLPTFDTTATSFDYWQLFSPNRFSGPDRQMDANNLTGAITTRLLDDQGVERVSASFGQIRYFSQQRVQLPNGQTTVVPDTNWSGSDYVAQLNLHLTQRWSVYSTYQWSPNTRRTDVAAFELQHRLGTDGIINFGYHYRRGLLEQYSASAVYPLSDRWRLIGSASYSVPIKGTTNDPSGFVEALAGIEFDSCCVTLRLVDRSYVNAFNYGQTSSSSSNSNMRDNAVLFEVVFKGLGSTGGQIDPLLHRDILGYQ